MSDPLSLTVTLHLRLPPLSDEAHGERLWRDAFEPLIGAIHHNPDVRLGLVLAGQIVEDFQQRHPEGIEWVRGLLERGQVELLASPVHEPLTPLVPERDVIAQLKSQTVALRKVFGVRPRGAWLPWAVWDPSWPRILNEAGLEFTLIPDRYLEDQGEAKGHVSGIYRTEVLGQGVAMLPTDQRVRDVAGLTPVKKILGHLSRRGKRGHGLVHLALSADNFGLRPGAVPKKANAWFATFIASLAKARAAVDMLLPSAAVDRPVPSKRVYMPMVAPAAIGVPVARALTRYVEADRLHKKMLRVSRLVERIERNIAREDDTGHRPDPTMLLQVQRYLHRAQNGEVYWHGTRGGVAHPALRALAWKDLLRAEKTGLRELRMHKRYAIERLDLNCDGTQEVVCTTPSTSAVIDPATAGALTEYALFPLARNLVDTYTRVDEPYHRDLREWDLADAHDDTTVSDTEATQTTRNDDIVSAARTLKARNALAADEHPRSCFVDRFLPDDVTIETLRRGTYAEAAPSLHDTIWEVTAAERYGRDALRTTVTCDATVSAGGSSWDVGVSKRYTVKKGGGLDVRHEVLNRSHDALRLRVAVELNLSLMGSTLDRCGLVVGERPRILDDTGDAGEAQELRLNVGEATTVVRIDKPTRVLHYPIESVEHDGEGWRRVLQGVCILLVWPVELWGQEKAKATITVEIEA